MIKLKNVTQEVKLKKSCGQKKIICNSRSMVEKKSISSNCQIILLNNIICLNIYY